MRQGKFSSKALAALLAILMVLSVVVALPAAAEETAPATAEKVLYSLDMSTAGALDADATAAWLANNNGFATTATNTNTIDADGFYKITQGNVVMSNGAPNDFFNLLAGWYPGYETPGKTYEITMDVRLDKESTYLRPANATYTDANGTEYTTLYTEESGHSFFAARVGGNYESLFRIGTVDGTTYLFAESNTNSVGPDNYKEVGNVFVKDAEGNKIYVAEDSGSVSEGAAFGLAYIIDPERSYAVEAGNVYALRIVYELTKYVTSNTNGGETTVNAHLYVKGENDAEETYLGFTKWTSKANSAANGFRLSDASGVVSFANVKVTVDEPATVVWSADLTKFGPNADGNATSNNLTSGHLATAMALCGQTLASTSVGNSAKLVDGMFHGGNNATSIKADGTYSPFADLLTGNFVYNGQKLTSTFIEFDYQITSAFAPASRSDTSVTVDGKEVNVTTDYAATGGATYNLRFRSNNRNDSQLFRISPNGYLFTTDLEVKIPSTKTGVDGYLYYMDGETKVFFDAEGYRYTLNGDAKNYIDDTSADAPAVSGLELIGCVNPAKLDTAYLLTKGETYRVGVKNVVTDVTAGKSTIKQTVYIKAEGDTEWTLVGTSTQYWYDETAYGSNANYQIIWPAGTGGMMFGGNMVAYACVDGQHLDGYDVTTENALSDTGIAYEKITCDLCGVSAKKDGVFYTSQAVSSKCETSYTLFTATNGSGKTFITDVTEGSHNYATSTGLCSKCNHYVYMPDVARRGSTALAIAGAIDQATRPKYDSATGHIVAPNGGMALCWPTNDLNPRSPFIMTLEFKITEAIVNNTSRTSSWPLLSYRVGNGETSVLVEYVGVDVVDDQLTLMLGTYRDRPIATIEYNEWYTLQIAVVPASDTEATPSTSDARIYLNGEMIGEKYDFGFVTGVAQTGDVRVGVQTALSYYRFGWEARYVDFQQTDLAGAYTEMGTNEVINIRYDRFQTGSPSHGGARSVIGTTMTGLRPESVVGGKYGILEGTYYKTISLSTLLANGEEFGLSGKKYEINVKFAVPNDDGDEDGVVDALSWGAQNLVRLSKYADKIQSILLSYRSWGQVHANNKDLVTAAGEPISVLRDFDENGVPTSVLDLRVVVDEANNTYSVYADGKVAYYWNGDVLTPAINLTMPLNQNGGTGKTTYGSITKADANAAGVNSCNYQYMRLFRDMSKVALEEVSVRLIPDNDLELVGTQVKSADFTGTGGFDLRFVFGVNDIYVNAINFEIKAYKNGEYIGVQYASTQTVLKGIIEDQEVSYACKYGEGDYLAAVRVRGIDETNSTNVYTFEITAYTTINGTDPVCLRTYTVSCNGVGGNVRTVANHISQ